VAIRFWPTAADQRRRAAFQWIGLAAALLAVTAVVYVVRPPEQAPAGASPASVAPGSATAGAGEAGENGVTVELNAAIAHYERAIAELQTAAGGDASLLEPATAATIAAEGQAIDRAIAESRAAVSTSPESEPARVSLFEALRRKIAMLQATVSLISEMNQGDPAGAAEAAQGLGRKS
jgi:hypothetical protein